MYIPEYNRSQSPGSCGPGSAQRHEPLCLHAKRLPLFFCSPATPSHPLSFPHFPFSWQLNFTEVSEVFAPTALLLPHSCLRRTYVEKGEIQSSVSLSSFPSFSCLPLPPAFPPSLEQRIEKHPRLWSLPWCLPVSHSRMEREARCALPVGNSPSLWHSWALAGSLLPCLQSPGPGRELSSADNDKAVPAR